METIKEIKQQMCEAFMDNEDVQKMYGFAQGEAFEDKFSKASIEGLLFYVVASIIYLREKALELWREDVEKTAKATRYGTKEWWHTQALKWQKGDSVQVDTQGVLGYEVEDEDKKIIKYAAIRSEGRAVYIRVAKEEGEELTALTGEETQEFQSYVNDIKPLGIMAVGQSFEACKLEVKMSVYFDGQRDITEMESSVKTAIKEYLKGITFGGEVIKNKMIDKVQEVSGVNDVEIASIIYDDNGDIGTAGRVLQAKAGYYKAEQINMTMIRE